MAVEIAPIEVKGLKEALKELNSMDKKLRRQITRDFKQIVQPVIDDAYNRMPAEAPLSGMARSWKPKDRELMNWKPYQVRRNLKAFTSGKKVRDTGLGFTQNLGVFGIRWAGPQATIFDMARRGRIGYQMTERYGSPSRVIWKAYEAAETEVQIQVTRLVDRVMRMTGRKGIL